MEIFLTISFLYIYSKYKGLDGLDPGWSWKSYHIFGIELSEDEMMALKWLVSDTGS